MNLTHRGAFENVAFWPGKVFQQARQIFERMKPRLIGEADSSSAHERNRVKVTGFETKLGGKLRVLSQLFSQAST